MIDYKVGDKVTRKDNDSFVSDDRTYTVEKFLFRVGQVTPYLVEVSDDSGTPSFFDPKSLSKVVDCNNVPDFDAAFKAAIMNFKPEVQVSKGVKYDPNKLQYSLIPPYAIEEVARNLTIGLKKYPHRDNWKLVENAEQRYLDALIRHLEAHRKGEVFDPDNPSVYHLAAVAVNALFLLEFMANPDLDSEVFNKEEV